MEWVIAINDRSADDGIFFGRSDGSLGRVKVTIGGERLIDGKTSYEKISG